MKVAICGGMCSGKTTLSKYISKEFNLETFSFADAVKMYASQIFDMQHKDRRLIQDFAEKLKEIDPDIWIKILDKKIKNIDNIVIDDLRFKNEYKYLRKNGFTIIRINIELIEQLKRLKNTYPDTWKEHADRLTHTSEVQRTYFNVDADFVSNNSLCNDVSDYIKLLSFNQ